MATVKKIIKKAQNGALTRAEMDALSHQKRGMGSDVSSFVKKAGPIKNETGVLTTSQQKQLKSYMNKAGTAKKIYEGLPNVGRMIGKSAADIPKGSQLEKQKNGGKMKKATKAAKGSGKKPTSAMLKQEKKIKAKAKK
jgi:hypothetical protein